MGSFGTRTIATQGRRNMASTDGRPQWKHGGITFDWSTVTAVVSDTTLADGTIILAGDKYVPAGHVLCRITASGKFGPYASGAADGRQTLTVGNCFILNENVILSESGSDHPAVFDGGAAWQDRLDPAVSGPSTNPTLANLRTAFPRVQWVKS